MLRQDTAKGLAGEGLPEKVMAMTLDLCERWRAEQERRASTLLRSGSLATTAPLLQPQP